MGILPTNDEDVALPPEDGVNRMLLLCQLDGCKRSILMEPQSSTDVEFKGVEPLSQVYETVKSDHVYMVTLAIQVSDECQGHVSSFLFNSRVDVKLKMYPVNDLAAMIIFTQFFSGLRGLDPEAQDPLPWSSPPHRWTPVYPDRRSCVTSR